MISSHTTKRSQTLHFLPIELGWELDPRFEMKCPLPLSLSLLSSFSCCMLFIICMHLHVLVSAALHNQKNLTSFTLFVLYRTNASIPLPSRPFIHLSIILSTGSFAIQIWPGQFMILRMVFFFSFLFTYEVMCVCETSACNQNALWQREQHSNRLEHFWLEWFDQCCCEYLSVQTMRKKNFFSYINMFYRDYSR